ncbi:Thiazole biosynthesis protein ThiH [gamma proteobacterium IMCC1989]|nr:Thiazole biosynthesis protein ThiH [gamma proteobacterium IMCC1989]
MSTPMSQINHIDESFYFSIFSSAKEIFLSQKEMASNAALLGGKVDQILENRDPKKGLSAEDAATLLHLVRTSPDETLRNKVMAAAKAQRERTFGHTVATMVPIEVSSFCASTCKFCGWRADNKDMARLSITTEAIRQQAKILATKGFSHFEIAGGDDLKLLKESLPDLVNALKTEVSKVNPASRVSICLVPMYEKNYSDLKKVGLDCVLTWQETYDEDLYNYHIPSGPKAWGVDENLKLQKKSDKSIGFLHRLQSQEFSIRAGLQAGLGAMIGLSPTTEADILSVVMHGQKLLSHYGDHVQPMIIGMPAWNAIMTEETDQRIEEGFDFDTENNFELLSAFYLLAFPDKQAWVFSNGRVAPEIQQACITTAACFTSTQVEIAPVAYLVGLNDADAQVDVVNFQRTHGFNEEDITKKEILDGEQFKHYYELHESFVEMFVDNGLDVVNDSSYLPAATVSQSQEDRIAEPA